MAMFSVGSMGGGGAGTLEATERESAGSPAEATGSSAFFPAPVETLAEAGLDETYVEALILKHLLATGSNTGRGVATDLCLPGRLVVELLTAFKNRQLVVYKGQTSMSDFQYVLTEAGCTLARRYLAECTYSGAAPVPFAKYVESVAAQTIENERPGVNELRAAFNDLLISDSMLERLGPAINSGRGLFLFGFPGNGKTSIAERITGAFGSDVWMPKAIIVDGETILLYDPQCHHSVSSDQPSIVKGAGHDRRWIKIKRPTIVVGGELHMDALELRFDVTTKITAAPLQLKSNCGTLVIDDFGRQRMDPDELLNRWIVPLEKRFDYLTLHNGKKIQVPFDQLIVFSTNLEPKDLVDDAFLRRIPYKINVVDPSDGEFRELMMVTAKRLGVAYDGNAVDHLVEKHYVQANRPFRCCHPRDLLLQIKNRATYLNSPCVMTPETFDFACETYFTLL
ncbi:MAG: AAA family ATPase [Phycisphaerae bacterium]